MPEVPPAVLTFEGKTPEIPMYPSLCLMSVCILVSVAVILSGCVPYPAYKLVQPEASATILDEAHRPMPDARVVLVIRAHLAYWMRMWKSRQTTMARHRSRLTSNGRQSS